MLTAKVYRFDPDDTGTPRFDSFHVPVPSGGRWTVMDVLEYIRRNLDSSLSYYSHSTCDHGMCARCTLKVDGRACLACVTLVPDEGELVLEPLTFERTVKDLVVR